MKSYYPNFKVKEVCANPIRSSSIPDERESVRNILLINVIIAQFSRKKNYTQIMLNSIDLYLLNVNCPLIF